MDVRRDGHAQDAGEPCLPWRAIEQVIAADDLGHALRGIVDDDGEVVGRNAVATADDEVVDDPRDRASEPIVDGHRRPAGPDPQRRRTVATLRSLDPSRVVEVAARPGIGAFGQRAVGSRGCLGDLAPRAETGVQQTSPIQGFDRRLMAPTDGRVGLPDDRPVVIETERVEVGEVLVHEFVTTGDGIEVFDADEEAAAVVAGEQPCQQRGAEVADVQRSGWTRGESTVGHVASSRTRPGPARLVPSAPMHDDAVLGRLRALADLRRWGDLERAARDALDEQRRVGSTTDPALVAHLARALLLQDRVDEAIEVSQSGLTEHPTDAWLARVLTSALVAGGRTDDAADELDRLLAADPDGYHVRVLAARVALRRFRLDEADAHARAAIAADPSRAGGHVMLAATLSQSGRPLEAEQVARDGLMVDPASGDLHGQLAVALERTGRPEEAIEHWIEAGRVGRYPQVAIDGLRSMLADRPPHGVWLAVGVVVSVVALTITGVVVDDSWTATVTGIALAAVGTLVLAPLIGRAVRRRQRRRTLAKLPPEARSIIELAGGDRR